MVDPGKEEVTTTDGEMDEQNDQVDFVREHLICSSVKHSHFETLPFTLIKRIHGEKGTEFKIVFVPKAKQQNPC